MNKILLIIQREYLTRVKKKSFIIMSLLGPLLMGGLIAGYIYLAMNQGDNLSVLKVVDETGVLARKLNNSKTVIFQIDTMPITTSRHLFNPNTEYGILYLPANALTSTKSPILFTEKQPNLTVVSYIEGQLQKEIESLKLTHAGIQQSTLDSIKTTINLQQKPVDPSGKDKEFSAGLTAGVGFAGGLLIYLFIFMYGVQVMRGVIEEKTSRIVEVIISSVKPFQLMMGKIIGIALVGLTQFLLWIVLTIAISGTVTNIMMGKDKEKISEIQQNEMMKNMQAEQSMPAQAPFNVMDIFAAFNVPKLLFCFVFYFLGGYLLYSALFAAIGAAVDSETDTQQFMLPITIPLIFAYVVSTIVMSNPESTIGYWFSIIPLTSPIVMMVRMPFDPPVTDIIISMVLLVAGFVFTTWIAARIYRTGILMYGKKPTYKEIAKWLFYKS
jgi:ABC-2 type transport system permease protein